MGPLALAAQDKYTAKVPKWARISRVHVRAAPLDVTDEDAAHGAQVILRLAASDRLPRYILTGAMPSGMREAEAARAADADR